MFEKILIANRGEIALRIQRACREMGIKTVAVHSQADADAKYVKLADESVCIGPAPSAQSYLNIPAIISAAEVTDAEAIHPGYGFLSENADFAERVEKSGFVFIGPRPETIRLMGDKVSAKNAMKKAGVPCVPGSNGALPECLEEVRACRAIGYPIIIKARRRRRPWHACRAHRSRIVQRAGNHAPKLRQLSATRRFMEKYLENPRHIEFQVLADEHRNASTRESVNVPCSAAPENSRRGTRLGNASPFARQNRHALCRCMPPFGYRGVGTFKFRLRETNSILSRQIPAFRWNIPLPRRLAELIWCKRRFALRLVKNLTIRQRDASREATPRCRINAEDPYKLTPSAGRITQYHSPGGPGIRVDSHIYNNYLVPPYYDSLIGKVIA